MKIVFGCDHWGPDLKETLKEHVRSLGHEIIDVGTNGTESVDYPVFGRKAALMVQSGEADRGILVCGTGFGISLSANRLKGIRCVNTTDENTVILSRHHNNSNMIALGARIVTPEQAIRLVDLFLTEEFDGGRHQRRIDLIDA